VPPKDEEFGERKVGILLVEDNEDDAYFILSELKKGGIAHVSKCVTGRDEFISALAEFKPDLVLSDYKLPEFAEMEPLRLVREKSPDLPFILVTGALGEELSVEVIKEGATDYILKDRLFRLVPAVERALREADERTRRREADALLKKQHEQLQRQNVALQESEERFRQLAENIREVFWMTDTQKNQTIYVSPGYEAIWGRSCQRLYESARDWVDAIHREDRERVLQAALEKQVLGECDEVYRIVRPDGSIRWIHDRAFPVRNEAGEVYRVTGIAEDITERKMAERRLEARNEVIKALAVSGTLREASEKILESIGKCLDWDIGAFWEVEGEPKALRCLTFWRSVESQAQEFVDAVQNKGYGIGEEFPGQIWKLGRPVWRPNADEETSFVFPRAPIAARCGLHGAFGFPVLVRDEVVGVVEFFSRQIREPDKALLEMVSALGHQIGQFIRRKQAEEALREAEENYRSIYENAIEGIFQTTPEGRYLSANPALARMLGYGSPEELIASISDIGEQMCVRAESRLELKRRLEAEGQVRGFENQIGRKDGRTIWISVNAHIVRDADGKVLYYEGTSQDITERKQLEQEVIETSANERRRVGHELHDGLGQYLAGIAFKAKALEQSLVAESLPHGAEAKELAALVSNAISQTRSLARGLDPIEVETIGLQAALENLAVETQKFFNVSCRFQCSENVPEVDPQVSLALYRVVQEAIHNGITHGEARSIEIELGMNGSNLCLRVQDDGTGFQAEESRQGGIGLRVMQYRARSIGGSLQVNSQPQRGTEVQCVVPRRSGLSGKVEANQETSEESDNGNEQSNSVTSRAI
jgi:PAS domain S-box-containing protein